jgi:hypothetical protein
MQLDVCSFSEHELVRLLTILRQAQVQPKQDLRLEHQFLAHESSMVDITCGAKVALEASGLGGDREVRLDNHDMTTSHRLGLPMPPGVST